MNGRERTGCLIAGLAWIVFALLLNAFVTAGDCSSNNDAICESARSRNYLIAFAMDAVLLGGIFYAFLRNSTKD